MPAKKKDDASKKAKVNDKNLASTKDNAKPAKKRKNSTVVVELGKNKDNKPKKETKPVDKKAKKAPAKKESRPVENKVEDVKQEAVEVKEDKNIEESKVEENPVLDEQKDNYRISSEPSKDELILSKNEVSDVDDLVAIDNAVRLEEEKKKEQEIDRKIEDTFKDEYGIGEEAAREEEEKKISQTEMAKNTFEPIPAFKGENCEEEVEKLRSTFKKGMSKSRMFSTITMLILIAGIVGGYLLYRFLPENLRWLAWTVFGILGAGLVTSFIISARMNKKAYTNVDKYVREEIGLVNSYVFTDDNFGDPQYSVKGHVDLEMIIEAHYFDTINAINSRNIVKVNYLNREMTVSEVAVRVPYQNPADGKDYSQVDKKKLPAESYACFGKYITYPLALEGTGDIIVLLRGKNAYLPTYLDGYLEVKIDNLKDDYLVWSTQGDDARKAFTPEIVALLNDFNSDGILENTFFSINPKGLKWCLNYSEAIMEVPIDKPRTGEPFKHYRDDLVRVCAIISSLSSLGK